MLDWSQKGKQYIPTYIEIKYFFKSGSRTCVCEYFISIYVLLSYSTLYTYIYIFFLFYIKFILKMYHTNILLVQKDIVRDIWLFAWYSSYLPARRVDNAKKMILPFAVDFPFHVTLPEVRLSWRGTQIGRYKGRARAIPCNVLHLSLRAFSLFRQFRFFFVHSPSYMYTHTYIYISLLIIFFSFIPVYSSNYYNIARSLASSHESDLLLLGTAYRLDGLTSSECSLRSPRSTTGSKVPHVNGNERLFSVDACE